MAESKGNDLKKWVGPTSGGEVARGFLQVRIGLVDLHNMLVAMKSGNETAFTQAQKSFLKADEELRKIINEVGGLGDG